MRMFKFQIHALALRKLGMGKPLRVLFLVVLLGAILVGLLYAFTMFTAVSERSAPHAHANSSQR
jgi:hypothetical protein